jgi:hypothetical protein
MDIEGFHIAHVTLEIPNELILVEIPISQGEIKVVTARANSR